jgi:hypothetical protein
MAYRKVLDALKDYLIEKLDMDNVSSGWPDASKELVMPAISIIPAGRIEVVNKMPILKAVDVANKIAKYSTKQFNFNIQLDAWESYDEKLQILVNQIEALFDNPDSTGIALSIDGTIATFYLVGHNDVMNGEMAQKNEFRASLEVNCTYDNLVDKEVSLMEVMQLKSRIDEFVKKDDDTNEIKTF